ncbi:MAG: methylmalonyl-CoA mutase small subunit [Acidobacteria bacterium]|nr:methylmalonyl-CoA mutase small subunit [Acidobacteriota bacterium]
MSEQNATALFSEFPPVTTAEWEAVIQKDLKGADYDKRLVWKSRTGLAVRPYYRRENLEGLDYLLNAAPGQFPYVRGTRAANDWSVREEVDEAGMVEANASAKAAVASGADSILFRRAYPKTLADLRTLLDGLGDAAVHLWGDGPSDALAALIRESGLALRGSLKLHPFAEADLAAACLKSSPGPAFRPVAIRRASFLEAGATSVQEVAFLLAAGIDYIRWMTARGVTVDQAAQGVSFGMFVGTSYFLQIAKFRAFRMLWARVVDAFGGSREAAKAYIMARTASWNHSLYDPYNNVLRGTTEAMSAVIGGVDSLSVGSFDEVYKNADDASRRLARNTQVILKQEAWLDRAVDPGAGSYYVETLTDALAKAAWKLMQEVESIGGYLKARDSGMIPNEVRQARKKAEDALAQRRRVIVGTNNYPNLGERMLDKMEQKDVEIVYGRGAEVFEDIRLRTERFAAAGGKAPLFLLAEMGDLKMRKARSGFILNFLGCGGFGVKISHFATVEALAEGAAKMGASAVVLCSSDDEYAALAAPAVAALKGLPVIVAGAPKNADELKAAGVADFINIKSNAVDTLKAWQDRLGVRG